MAATKRGRGGSGGGSGWEMMTVSLRAGTLGGAEFAAWVGSPAGGVLMTWKSA